MAIPRPSVTTSSIKSKGLRCYGCGQRVITTVRMPDGKFVCNDCAPEKYRSPVEPVPPLEE